MSDHICGSKITPITENELKIIPTKVLLEVYRSWANHHACGDYECVMYQRCVEIAHKNVEVIKAELDTREHIPNKFESKAIRKFNKKRGPKKEKCCRR